MTIEEMQTATNDVMSGLKDFQQKTVDHVIDMYLNKGISRFLVSDEVGLGKTMIAKGVLSKMAEEYAKVGKTEFKAVYFCSNENIIKQNLGKLCFCDEMKLKKNISPSDLRITMQSLMIYNQQKAKTQDDFQIHLIPLTPGTSVKISSNAGTNTERKLIFHVIKSLLQERSDTETTIKDFKTLMLNGISDANWEDNKYEDGYIESMKKDIRDFMEEPDCRFKSDIDFINLINSATPDVFTDEERKQVEAINSEENKTKFINKLKIGCLRQLFAQISLSKLHSDLVIMDEFQRFKDLLDAKPGSSTKMLMDKFINGSEQKILLLSATPFKPFVSSDQMDDSKDINISDNSNSLQDFLDVIGFLKNVENYNSKPLEEHSKHLAALSKIGLDDKEGCLEAVKNSSKNVSNELYENICRTERVSDKDSLSLNKNVEVGFLPAMEDIVRFLEANKLANYAETTLPIDYSNSTPYIMSFALASEYKFKKRIEEKFKQEKTPPLINKIDPKHALWIEKDIVDAKEEIPCKSAKLQNLIDTALPKDIEQLLWIPPSRPYYAPQGIFAKYYNETELRIDSAPTKTIVFSRYRMVPRMIASMISYEAERRIGKSNPENNDSIDSYLLKYPSEFLCKAYFKPADYIGKSIDDIRNDIKAKIQAKLHEFVPPACDKEYALFALLLLDCDKTPIDNNEYSIYLKSKIKKLSNKLLVSSYIQDSNKSWNNMLIDDLADLAIASPAVCYYRMLYQYTDEPQPQKAKDLAEKFIKYLYNPMSRSVLKKAYTGNQPFWRKALNYCLDGNIQAVLDEYSHIISDGYKNKADEVVEQMEASMEYHTQTLKIDTFDNFDKRIRQQKENDVRISIHYATSVIENDSGEDKDGKEKRNPLINKMNAFNSPFRPFVLASTSIGQEGLDFHKYCRRLIHWNLPTNPIDLEQREGRIDRYKSLAIRQNIAINFGDDKVIRNKLDVWAEMFYEANRHKPEACSDLIPYWILWKDDRKYDRYEFKIKIESLYPVFELSKEVELYRRLDYLKTICRLAMGQSDQEELLNGIMKNFPNIDKSDDFKDLFIDISPLNR